MRAHSFFGLAVFGDPLIRSETSTFVFFLLSVMLLWLHFQKHTPPNPFAKQSILFQGLCKLLNTVSGISWERIHYWLEKFSAFWTCNSSKSSQG